MRLIKSEPDSDEDCCTQSEMDTWPPVGIPTSPLDLSMNSKTFKFVHPRTPEQTHTKSPFMPTGKPDVGQTYPIMSSHALLEPPRILIQPKTEWHYRNLRDLANKHIPLLSGDGPQRTPIRIHVPRCTMPHMYLMIRILNDQGEPHQSKVIIPAKTSVDSQKLGHDNNLDYLEFDKCNPNDHCFPNDRLIISRISDEERQLGYKDVRICMFNLYQNAHLTKELIETNKLHLCKLSFHFCTDQRFMFAPISEPTFSLTITEKRNTTQSRSSPVTQISHIDYPTSGFIIPVISQNSNEPFG